MKKSRKPFWLIMGISLGIILISALASGVTGVAIAGIALFFGNLLGSLIAFIAKKKDIGKVFLLAAGLCLLIGFGFCVSSLSGV